MQVKHLERCLNCSITIRLYTSIQYQLQLQGADHLQGLHWFSKALNNNSYMVSLPLSYVPEVQQVRLPEGQGQDGSPGLSDGRACAFNHWAIQPCATALSAFSELCSCSQRSLLSFLSCQCGQAHESQRVLVLCIPHRLPGPSSLWPSISCKPCAGSSTLSPPDACK